MFLGLAETATQFPMGLLVDWFPLPLATGGSHHVVLSLGFGVSVAVKDAALWSEQWSLAGSGGCPGV